MPEDPGSLLVRAGLVSEEQVLLARQAQAKAGGTLGEHLVLAGFIDDEALTSFYTSRLVIPRVEAPHLARIPASVLRRIPADMAAELRVVPVTADGEHNLTVAMSDPANKHAVDEVTFFTGSYVVRAAATQLQIAWCLAHYYGIMTPLAQARLVGSSAQVSPKPANRSPEPVEEDPTGPSRMPTYQRVRRRGRSPGLPPRSGTVDVASPPAEPEKLPAVLVEDDELTGTYRAAPGRVDEDTEEERLIDLEDGVDALPDDWDSDDLDTDPGADRPRDEDAEADSPILLDRPSRRATPPPPREAGGSGEILLLDQVKRRRPRTSQQTQPGLGKLGQVDSRRQAVHDTDDSLAPGRPEETGDEGTVSGSRRSQSRAHRRGKRDQGAEREQASPASGSPLSPEAGEASPAGAPATTGSATTVDDPDLIQTLRREGAKAAGAGNASGGGSDKDRNDKPDKNEKAAKPAKSDWNVDEGWDVDDGWGPPGTTIPPPYLGALPGTYDDVADSGSIPLTGAGDAREDAAEVIQAENAVRAGSDGHAVAMPGAVNSIAAVATAAAHSVTAPTSPAPVEPELTPAQLAAELERSSNRLLETLRVLERAPARDPIIDLLLDHLGGLCRRRAFYAVKGGALFAFRQQGAARPGIGTAEMALDQPSTFAQVAIGRIPYQGTLSPSAVEFVERSLGSPAKGESVVVPVVVRGRTVGLLYGDGLQGRVFDEHQMVLGRAAGQALERILQKQKSS